VSGQFGGYLMRPLALFAGTGVEGRGKSYRDSLSLGYDVRVDL
jgi:hypothetical protein